MTGPPVVDEGRPDLARFSRALPIISGVLFVLLVSALSIYFSFGSFGDAWLYAKGNRVVIEPKELDFGSGVNGESHTLSFRIRNLSNRPVSVVGASTTCSCVSCDGLPIKVPPTSSQDIPVALHFEGKTAVEVVQAITIHTDHPNAPTLKGVVRCRVLSVPSDQTRSGK